jgi:hypothetical protein
MLHRATASRCFVSHMVQSDPSCHRYVFHRHVKVLGRILLFSPHQTRAETLSFNFSYHYTRKDSPPACTTSSYHCGGILHPNTTDLGSARRQLSSLDAGTRATDLQHVPPVPVIVSYHSLLPAIQLPSASISSLLDETTCTPHPRCRDKRQSFA